MNRLIRTGLFLAFGSFACAALALEYPIGTPQNVAGMEIAAVYLQPIDMEPEGHMRKASETDIHLEADIHALANNANGFPEGFWVPHLLVKYELVKQGTNETIRGDLTVEMPLGSMGDNDGTFFAHVRLGQGNGIGLRRTYTSTPNTVAFEKAEGPDDSFAILAQAWYQLKMPLNYAGRKEDARDHLYLTVGKIDPFVFFDQNAAADDESTKGSSAKPSPPEPVVATLASRRKLCEVER